ncbi:hypothetical protein EBR96_05480, partial [bacterium]|nr:hypothetical protein [bacterium]
MTLKVAANSYWVNYMLLHPDDYPTGDAASAFAFKDDCLADSEAELCPVKHFAEAQVRCELVDQKGSINDLEVLSISEEASEAASFSSCVKS